PGRRPGRARRRPRRDPAPAHGPARGRRPRRSLALLRRGVVRERRVAPRRRRPPRGPTEDLGGSAVRRLSRRAALLAPGGHPPWLRRSRPYLPIWARVCVLASKRASRPDDERRPAKPPTAFHGRNSVLLSETTSLREGGQMKKLYALGAAALAIATAVTVLV